MKVLIKLENGAYYLHETTQERSEVMLLEVALRLLEILLERRTK